MMIKKKMMVRNVELVTSLARYVNYIRKILSRFSFPTEPEPEKITSALHADYAGCGEYRGCFGLPEGCVETGDCQAMVTYTLSSDETMFDFVIHGSKMNSGEYVAMALSSDEKMGEDLVIHCIEGNYVATFFETSFLLP